MKQTLHSLPIRWLAIVLLLLGGFVPAFASHIQGGQISYRYLGPGAGGNTDRYEVTVSFYRDCTGIDLPTGAIILQARRGGCNTVAQTASLSPVGVAQVGQPYCPRIQAGVTCSSSSTRPLYEFRDFVGTIDLLPAPEWVLSYDDSARPNTANLTGQGSFRFEARLNSLVTPAGSTVPLILHNTSAQFSDQDKPVPYVSVNQPASVLFAGSEPDGDSVVYALDSPLESCGTPNVYKTRAGTCVAPTPVPGCTFTCPTTNGPGQLYTPQVPIDVVYDVTGACPGARTLTPRLTFNAQTGLLQFTPRVLYSTAPVQGDNKYVVVCKISEYRLVPGTHQRVLVGSVRRDYLITVVDGLGNSSPATPTASLDPTQIGGAVVNTPLVTRISVASCNYSTARVVFTDPDNAATPGSPNGAGQYLTVSYTGAGGITALNNLLQNGEIGTATLTQNGSFSPVIVFNFQPNPAFIGTTLRLPFRVEDDACPIKGVQERIVEITVTDGRRVRVQSQITSQGLGNVSPVSICPGGSVNLSGLVTRVDSVRQLVSGVVRTVAQSYELRWTAPNNNGLPAVNSTRLTGPFNITVNPTVTTRYTLQANPLGSSAFPNTFPIDNNGQSVCGDTMSVLVRVVPEPTVAITTSATQICANAGTAVQLQALATRPSGVGSTLPDTYTYRWSGPGVPANTTGAALTVQPTALGLNTYTVVATGATAFGCDATKTIQIEVVPLPTARLVATPAILCPGSTASLLASATSNGVAGTYTYRFAPANGLAAADETKANPTVNPTVTTRYRVTITGDPRSGCSDTTSVLVRVLPSVVANFTASAPVDQAGNAVSRPPVYFKLTNQSVTTGITTGATIAYVWTYQRTSDLTGLATNDAAVTFANTAAPAPLKLEIAGNYTIKLAVTVSFGNSSCTTSTKLQTVVVPDYQIPNVITPNGDNQNDVFKVSSAGTASKMEIYNRWGRKVYEQANYQNNWGGDNQPAGVYYYLLTDRNGVQTKGWVEVVR
jgi:gliding motility-associated-like protein